MIVKGYRFGMLLQLAVGPVCLFVFQVALSGGLIPGIMSVAGVGLVDFIFILAAILGIGSVLKKFPTMQKYLKYFGALVLIVFGLSNIFGLWGIVIIPSIQTNTNHIDNVFLKTMLLTLSNPLTILFWAGVFSTKMLEEKMTRYDMYLFGSGAVLATLSFLFGVVLLGLTFKKFAPDTLIGWMNALVGIILIFFGMRLLLKKERL